MRGGIRIASLVASGAIAACFGAGPTPQQLTGVDVVFAIAPPADHSDCGGSDSLYIGDVAIGSDSGAAGLGFAWLFQYNPGFRCDNNTGGPPTYMGALWSFAGPALGGAVVDATVNNSAYAPRVAIRDANYEDAYFGNTGGSNASNIGIVVDPGMRALNSTMTLPHTNFGGVTALVDDGATRIIAATDNVTTSSVPDVDDPAYPLGSAPSFNNTPTTFFLDTAGSGSDSITATAGPQVVLACDTLHACVVQAPTSIAYMQTPPMEHQGSAAAEIWTIDTSAGPAGFGSAAPAYFADVPKAIDSLPVVPVGLDADSTDIVWSASVDYRNRTSGHGCWIWRQPIGSASPIQLLATENFSCMDLAIDRADGDLYFAIVDYTGDDYDHSSGLRGIGIGRVDSSGALESISLGFTGYETGPRRVVVRGDHVYAIDATEIGRLATSLFTGKNDFTP
ncbi:MAG: hypothetical protein ABI591_23905 [Kofleriaceae bacterium]